MFLLFALVVAAIPSVAADPYRAAFADTVPLDLPLPEALAPLPWAGEDLVARTPVEVFDGGHVAAPACSACHPDAPAVGAAPETDAAVRAVVAAAGGAR